MKIIPTINAKIRMTRGFGFLHDDILSLVERYAGDFPPSIESERGIPGPVFGAPVIARVEMDGTTYEFSQHTNTRSERLAGGAPFTFNIRERTACPCQTVTK